MLKVLTYNVCLYAKIGSLCFEESNLNSVFEDSGVSLCLGEIEDELLYGTTDGKLGLVQVTDTSPVYKWEVTNQKKRGGMHIFQNFN